MSWRSKTVIIISPHVILAALDQPKALLVSASGYMSPAAAALRHGPFNFEEGPLGLGADFGDAFDAIRDVNDRDGWEGLNRHVSHVSSDSDGELICVAIIIN
jgi:hypothetical protein